MSLLEKIKEPVAKELSRYEEYVGYTLRSDHEMTCDMLSYIFENRGKAVRPLVVLLSASMFNGGRELSDKSFTGAMLVEMMHTSSLIHDDVIDESYMRRGKPSVKALWESHRAVLIGDYILAKSFSEGMQRGEYDILRFLVRSMTDLCEGELLQSDQSDRLTMTRDIYNEIISKKTASLFGTCSGIGAMSVGAEQDDIENMRDFGIRLGMAFQIKDDILDYSDTEKTGKPVCGDLRERKITLPLLTVLERSAEPEKKRIIGILSDVHDDPSAVDALYDIVVGGGGLQMASEIKCGYVDSARRLLERYPQSVYRRSLELLCDFIADSDI